MGDEKDVGGVPGEYMTAQEQQSGGIVMRQRGAWQARQAWHVCGRESGLE